MQGIAQPPSLEKNFFKFTSYIQTPPLIAVQHSIDITVHDVEGASSSSWTHDAVDEMTAVVGGPFRASSEKSTDAHLIAVIETVFARLKRVERIKLAVPLLLLTPLVRAGVVCTASDTNPEVVREAFWQWSRPWQPHSPEPFPCRYTLSGNNRHPIRRPKSSGIVYRRYIPWLDKTLSFRSLDPDRDLEIFHSWMNEPRVSEFWQEEGDLQKHQQYIQSLQDHPSHACLIGYFDEEPFGYFETYWTKEDRIALYYEADDFDRGFHLLVGDPAFRGRAYLSAWLPSLSHHLFLEDCRTQRIVVEPRADNHRIIGNLSKCGFAFLKEFSFPHKRAALGMLLRERFFDEALLIPRTIEPPTQQEK